MKPIFNFTNKLDVLMRTFILAIKKKDIGIKEFTRFLTSFLLIISPVIDLLNGVFSKLSFFSPGQIFRPFIMLLSIVLIYFLSKRAFKLLLIIIGAMGITALLNYFLFHQSLQEQVLWNARIMYTLVLTILFISSFSSFNERFINRSITYLEIAVGLIAFVIVLSALTGTGFNTYETAQGVGNKGFFLGQNDITAIISLSFPLVMYRFITEKENKITRGLNVLAVFFAAILLGTKSGLFFIFISLGIIIYIFAEPKRAVSFVKKNIKPFMIISILIIILITGFSLYFKQSLENWISYQAYFFLKSHSFITYLLSGRNKSILPMLEVLKDHPVYLFIGTTFIKGQQLISDKIGYPIFVEFDPLSIFFYNGIFIFILYFLVYIRLFKYIPTLLKGSILDKILLLSFGIGLLYSTLGGHVLPSGIAGTYFAYSSGLVAYFGRRSLGKSKYNRIF